MDTKLCFHCGCDITFQQEVSLVRLAVKPRNKPYRWAYIGKVCYKCEQSEPLYFNSIDEFIK